MNVIETVAPISIDLLKKYFEDNETSYVIDYNISTLKGLKLLIYLNNLDIPVDIKLNIESPEFQELLLEYFKCPYVLKIKFLETAALEVMLTYKGTITDVDPVIQAFVDNNIDIISRWASMLDSLTLYNMYIVNEPEFIDFVKSFPEDTTNNFGVNFVNLLKYPEFYICYSKIEKENLKYYSVYFNEYVFRGNNLFAYWANEENPLFILTNGIVDGVVEEEIAKLTN